MRRDQAAERGSAMLLTMGVASVILLIVTGLMTYANNERNRSISNARRTIRMSCAEAGLQLARGYYGRNYSLWNSTFLNNPATYNAPVTGGTAPILALQATAPQLFADLDGDGQPDVYLYIRDNQDEMLPAADNPQRDSDQNVIVGSVCVSSTMVPRLQDGQVSTNLQIVEGFLSYNAGPQGCSQANCGNGAGNMN